jgi:hypothetical protein
MKIKVSALLGTLLVFLLIGLAYARSSYMTSFNSRYGTSATVLNTCNLCHPGGDTGSYNPYGTDFLDAGSNTAAFAAIENLDSDGDGFTNIVEINARTFPGDPSSFRGRDVTGGNGLFHPGNGDYAYGADFGFHGDGQRGGDRVPGE